MSTELSFPSEEPEKKEIITPAEYLRNRGYNPVEKMIAQSDRLERHLERQLERFEESLAEDPDNGLSAYPISTEKYLTDLYKTLLPYFGPSQKPVDINLNVGNQYVLEIVQPPPPYVPPPDTWQEGTFHVQQD